MARPSFHDDFPRHQQRRRERKRKMKGFYSDFCHFAPCDDKRLARALNTQPMLWKRCLNARLPLPQPLSTCCFPRFTRFQRPGSWGCVWRALAQGGILMFCVCACVMVVVAVYIPFRFLFV
ncbi:hypothetical protein CCHR01_13192 [Colletotrichum chrysophilum]|uniref:Transmembrane protein n=1 Tax=Colletotrichum chrysophilum TaxID=1836956 RepID=A0AAD9A9W6_9PEZI|nr:hypothetical protein CCHR01_13192 [Colletotrichum chrysophilum]